MEGVAVTPEKTAAMGALSEARKLVMKAVGSRFGEWFRVTKRRPQVAKDRLAF